MVDRRTATELMTRFAERTGLTSGRAPRRYLWTDAFAVCNFLALGEIELALRLVEQTHRTLGQHRPDDVRRGWLGGLDASAGEAHPTRGGLRIGKPLAERAPAEASDPDLEWDRDGQYFHYLTRWMHALDQVARATGRAIFADWARELAAVSHRAFTHAPPGAARRRMYWKMSIDLTRPLVASMGQHDPLDGFVTCMQLGLAELAADFAAMIEPAALATTDPLGIGGLLTDAYRLEQLGHHERWRDTLIEAAQVGLRSLPVAALLGAPADRRLGFRELGLAIGLAAPLTPLASHAALRAAVLSFWLRPEHRQVDTWTEHADISDVMLATALVPDGVLVLGTGP